MPGDAQGITVADRELSGQSWQVIEILTAVLAAAGLTPDGVVEGGYPVDLANLPAVAAVKAEL